MTLILTVIQTQIRAYSQQFKDRRCTCFIWRTETFQRCFKEGGQSLWKQGLSENCVFVHWGVRVWRLQLYAHQKQWKRCAPGPPRIRKSFARVCAVLETCSQSLLTSILASRSPSLLAARWVLEMDDELLMVGVFWTTPMCRSGLNWPPTKKLVNFPRVQEDKEKGWWL